MAPMATHSVTNLAFIILESEVFKYNFLNIYIAKTMLYILLKFIQWTFTE